MFLSEAMNIVEILPDVGIKHLSRSRKVHVVKDAQQVGDTLEMYFDIQPPPKGKKT